LHKEQLALLDQLAMAADAHSKLVVESATHTGVRSVEFEILKEQVEKARRGVEMARAAFENHRRKHQEA
jgi:hypothetical protein